MPSNQPAARVYNVKTTYILDTRRRPRKQINCGTETLRKYTSQSSKPPTLLFCEMLHILVSLHSITGKIKTDRIETVGDYQVIRFHNYLLNFLSEFTSIEITCLKWSRNRGSSIYK